MGQRPQMRFPAISRLGGAGNNLIQNGTVQRRIADRYQLKETSPVPTLAPEIQAVTIVDDLTIFDREDTGVIASIGLTQAAVIGQNAKFEVFNPSSSNTLVRMIRMIVSHGDASAIGHFIAGLRTGSLGSGISTPVWNSRLSAVVGGQPSGNVVAGQFSQVGVSGASQMFSWWQQAFTVPSMFDLNGVVVPPGAAFVVQNQQQFMASDCILIWSEESLAR
jgi:hypothetical protein